MTKPNKKHGAAGGKVRATRKAPLSAADTPIMAPDSTSDTPLPAPADDQQQDIVLPDEHPAVTSWYDDPRAEASKIGKGNPPLHSRYKPGQSGNPRGRPKAVQPPPATLMSLIGKTLFEDLADLLRSPISDLKVHREDIAVRALAKQIVTDAVKGEGRSRTMVINCFMEPQRNSDRYKERDRGADEAERMSEMIKAIIDPTMTDERLDTLLSRWRREAEDGQFESERPSGKLPPLPKPPRSRNTAVR